MSVGQDYIDRLRGQFRCDGVVGITCEWDWA